MIYVLEFSGVLGNKNNVHGTAQTYIGWTNDDTVAQRIDTHRKGQGAKITAAAVEAGLELIHVALFPGDRSVERAFKNKKNAAKLLAQYRAGRIPAGLPAPLMLDGKPFAQ